MRFRVEGLGLTMKTLPVSAHIWTTSACAPFSDGSDGTTTCINQMVSESQHPHETVNLLFELVIVNDFVGELNCQHHLIDSFGGINLLRCRFLWCCVHGECRYCLCFPATRGCGGPLLSPLTFRPLASDFSPSIPVWDGGCGTDLLRCRCLWRCGRGECRYCLCFPAAATRLE